ncbi:hypothetical protein [Nostoc sp. CALU 1950]|uniref:hypothetical protein n=1 Tax=Nostoc sp. CALU 1950 TaxID=3104321 RepID=UPI003EBCB2F2
MYILATLVTWTACTRTSTNNTATGMYTTGYAYASAELEAILAITKLAITIDTAIVKERCELPRSASLPKNGVINAPAIAIISTWTLVNPLLEICFSIQPKIYTGRNWFTAQLKPGNSVLRYKVGLRKVARSP